MRLPAPTNADIQRVVDLVVGEVSPLRIVLFGSTARGEQREGSDLDLMVVMPEGADRRAIAQSLYELMYRHRVMVPTQFLISTPDGYAAHRATRGLVYREISRDGREVYAA
jgi:predicted nucleotidyltransferase